jgi:bifunctional protein TilS/HprT
LTGTKDKAYWKAVQRAAAVTNSAADLKPAIIQIVRGTARAMNASVSLMVRDTTGKKLVHHASWGLPQFYLHKGVLDAEKSLPEVMSGRPFAVLDIRCDSHLQYPDLAARAGIASILGVPLMINGEAVGSIRVYSRETREFSQSDIAFVTAMADLAAVTLRSHALNQTGSGTAQAEVSALRQIREVTFVHPSEAEFARILDFYEIEWVYEPRSFPLRTEGERITEMFTPDFYLPALDLYVELTTMKQSLVTEKNRKLRRLRELYPEIKITLLYKKDYDRLLAKYGFGPLALTKGHGISRVLHSTEELQHRVAELALQISIDYADKHPVMVGILRGVFCFMADLVRHITVPLDVEFMSISHYGGDANTASPMVKITKDMDMNVAGRHVIMVEDIVDTGMTLNYMLHYIKTKNPASIKVCTLIDKRVRRIVDVPLEYIGFEVPDEFVVGYGLDYQEEYRNLPFIGILGHLELPTGPEPDPTAIPQPPEKE